jgi:aryl carrier-like protein
MKKGEHIGKIVITMPDNPADIAATKVNSGRLFSDTATYLVVGGLGGLGRSVTRWMVEKGARNFCFLSRSAGDQDKHGLFLEEIRSQGCQAVAVSGSVAEMADVQKAIETSPSRIAGVLQMSMVLRVSAGSEKLHVCIVNGLQDLPVLKMGHADFRAAHDCKVKGTWNLHNALSNTDLDFFILMSSISASVGHPGQANYSSANSFLDSFAQYRQSLGLPCSVINLGGMEGVGFLSERPAKLNQYRSFGLYMLQEHHLVESIQLGLNQNVAPIDQAAPGLSSLSATPISNSNQFVVGLNTSKPLSDPTNRALYKGDIRVSLYNNIAPAEQGGGGGRDENIRELLTQVEMDPQLLYQPDTLKRVSLEVGRTLFNFLLLPEEDLDVTLTLSSIGIDSLVSIEIRNWWRKMLGLDITVLQIMNAGTIEGLGKLAITSLKKKYGLSEEGEEDADTDERRDGVQP